MAVAPPPLRERAPEVSEAIDAVVMRALSLEMEDRFAAMEEIVAAIGPQAPHPAPVAVTTGATAQEPAAAITEPTTSALGLRRWILLAAVAAVSAWVIVDVARARSLRHAGAPAPDAQVREARNAEAMAVYRMGAQAFRDASREAAEAALERATEIDPTLAEGHLLYVLNAKWPEERTRTHYLEALKFRQLLSPTELALLGALDGYMSVPQDLGASIRKLGAVAREHGDDADVLFALARLHSLNGEFREAIVASEGVLGVNPGFAAALRLKAYSLVALGDVDGSRATYAECLRVSPAATQCLDQRHALEQNEGLCVEALLDARRLIALDPSSPKWSDLLAEDLYATGSPADAARTAAAQSSSHLEGAAARMKRLETDASFALAEGDFEGAERALALRDGAVTSTAEQNHVWIAQARMEAALEAGEAARAAAIAAEYLGRRRAWEPVSWIDPTILAYGVQYRAGALSRDAFRTKRTAWLDAERIRANAAGPFGNGPGLRWTLAFAAPAIGSIDAREALEQLPKYVPLPDALTRAADYDEPVGAVYLFAGRIKEALPYLSRAAHSCQVLTLPFETTRASLQLGVARESSGDPAGACAEYGAVLRKWGRARPRSVTATVAAARASALGCRPP
jgi:serine/threonine-protein kinase